MGILITLRTNKDISYFRRNLLSLIGLPGDTVLLCSGYISEGTRYSISSDSLLNSISNSGSRAICIGGMFDYRFGQINRKKYMTFLRRLVNAGVNVEAYEATNNNWHAKVAMKLNKNIPLAVIVGSSNLTRPAYGEGQNKFNHEADVILWDSNKVKDVFIKEFENKYEALGPIIAEISKKFKQPDEIERMDALYKLIMNRDFLKPVDIY